MMLEDTLQLYLIEQIGIIEGFPIEQVARLASQIIECYKGEGMIVAFGNGGGASIAEHFVSDMKMHPFVSDDKHISSNGGRLQIYCLNESVGSMTRVANDMGYEHIFTEQLKNYDLCCGDMAIAFSTSGNSPNIVNAIDYCNKLGMTTVLIGGRTGGKVKDMVSISILIPGKSQYPGQVGANDNCFHIEDFQGSIAHMITGLLKEVINE